MKKSFSVIAASLVLVACGTGNCRQQAEAKNQSNSATVSEIQAATSKSAAVSDRVKVFKYDGSKQCGQGKQISIEAMQKDLGKIRVYSSANKMDGLMHMQVCGSNTGKANVYEIDRSSLTEAISKGFQEWTW